MRHVSERYLTLEYRKTIKCIVTGSPLTRARTPPANFLGHACHSLGDYHVSLLPIKSYRDLVLHKCVMRIPWSVLRVHAHLPRVDLFVISLLGACLSGHRLHARHINLFRLEVLLGRLGEVRLLDVGLGSRLRGGLGGGRATTVKQTLSLSCVVAHVLLGNLGGV